jgi:hypothetical protein
MRKSFYLQTAEIIEKIARFLVLAVIASPAWNRKDPSQSWNGT